MHRKKFTARPIWAVCLVWLLLMGLFPACSSGQAESGTPVGSVETDSPAEDPEELEPDTQGPVISGVQALTALVGETISYRTGVTATDGRDGTVPLAVDSSAVNLSVPGEYQVIYSAEDSAGNRTEVTATVVVTEPEPDAEPPESDAKEISLEQVNGLADQILEKILKDGMSKREKARAVFDYVASHVKYVGSSDKSGWIIGAYEGFTTGRGDCFTYFACSRALLSRADIPTVDLQREANSNSRHFWLLADVGEGYHHFDPCPHPTGFPLTCFLLTETQVRQYSVNLAAHSSYYKNYYIYDYDACPVPVEGMPTGEIRPTVTPAPRPATPEAPETTEPESPETAVPESPETAVPESPETAEPEGPETAEPEGSETAGPEGPETAGVENPAEPAGGTEAEASGSNEAAQEETPETAQGTPLGETENDSAQLPEGEDG